MARRQQRDDPTAPAVPRWVVEFDPTMYPDQGGWVVAVWDWVDAHVSDEHRGAAYDIKERAFKLWMGDPHGA